MQQDPRTAASIIHLALIGGQVAFFIVALMIERTVTPPENITAELLLTITIVIAGSLLIASHMVSSRMLRTATALATEEERLTSGLRAFIVRLALLEAAGLLSIVAYVLTGEYSFLGIFGIVFVAFLLRKPGESEWESLQVGTTGSASTDS